MNDYRPTEPDESLFGYTYRAFIGPDDRLRSIWRFLLSLIALLVANVAAGFVASLLGRGRTFELVYRPLSLVFVVAGFCILLVLADKVEGDLLAAMGLALRKPWLRDSLLGIAVGFFMVFIAYLVIRFTCELNVNLFLSGRAFKLLVAELFILAAAAMLEEVMFRGYPFQRLVDSFAGAIGWLDSQTSRCIDPKRSRTIGAWIAAIVWSSAFGAMHLGNPDATIWSFLNTSFVGILFCLAYLRTGSLWMPWGMHFAWNATLGVILGLPVSGLTQFGVIVRSKAVGPLWITGGRYGIEGSALGTAVIIIGIAIVILFVKPRTVTGRSELTDIGVPHQNSPESIQQ